MIGGGIAIAFFAVPFWLMVGTRSLPMIALAVTIGFAINLNSMAFGPARSCYSEQLPTGVRFSGLVLAAVCTYTLAQTAPRALRQAAIRAGVNDGSVPIEVEYAEVR